MSKSSTGRRKAAARIPRPAEADRTRQFYESRAQEYADVSRQRALAPLLADFSKRLPGGSILDLGCGAGYDMRAFCFRGHVPFGLDYSAAIAKIASANVHAPVVVADMRAIPFQVGAFDGVWASASFLHLPRGDLVSALNEVRRVLKFGGLLFASVKRGEGDFSANDGRFFTLYDQDDWERRLLTAGFRPISTEFNGGVRKDARGLPEQWMTSLAVAV
jgi:SAM-dependent methyltransferase